MARNHIISTLHALIVGYARSERSGGSVPPPGGYPPEGTTGGGWGRPHARVSPGRTLPWGAHWPLARRAGGLAIVGHLTTPFGDPRHDATRHHYLHRSSHRALDHGTSCACRAHRNAHHGIGRVRSISAA